MISETVDILASWSSLDSWIVVTAALAAMACALPGVFLLLRRQSLMGDALSHTVLLGLVLAFFIAQWLKRNGWVTEPSYMATRHLIMFAGAVVIGVVTAMLTQWVERVGRVEASAALGVVFTSLFALGLILIRVAADSVHIDPDCVLYGAVETVVMDTYGNTSIPRAAIVNASVLAVNLVLLVIFYKELRISTFDPQLATTLGIRASWVQYALTAVTAMTLVAAFETVGSILVIAMLIVPAATASLLTDRLSLLAGLSLAIAAGCAVGGHALAVTVPPLLFHRLGFPNVVDASTAGMMAAACGIAFAAAVLFAPRRGILSQTLVRSRLGIKVAGEDLLALLYRREEHLGQIDGHVEATMMRSVTGLSQLRFWLVANLLTQRGHLRAGGAGYRLTKRGRRIARKLVRSHRLWESYMAKHFALPDDHLHETAERVEHFLDPQLREELAAELDRPDQDPHRQKIPPEDPGDEPL